jgi:hypothetical protein
MFDVGGLVQVDADTCQRLAVGAEIQVFGVDQDTVVVEQYGVVRGYGRYSCLRIIRMSATRSTRYASSCLMKLNVDSAFS